MMELGTLIALSLFTFAAGYRIARRKRMNRREEVGTFEKEDDK